MKLFINKEKGQILILMILIMTIVLATGLSIIQKSLSDISTASKVEQSSRAFSAAEAGIEKALKANIGEISEVNFSETNSAAVVSDQGEWPPTVLSGKQQDPLEFPPMVKEDVAQVWLADFRSSNNPPPDYYKQTSLDIYWGNSGSDRAAIEITFLYYSGGAYSTSNSKWYFDHPYLRTPENGFSQVPCRGGETEKLGTNQYQCRQTLTSLPAGLKLLRARLLYNNNSQPFAVRAVGTCGTDCSIPSQARIIYSTGTSGETQRKIKVIQQENIVPYYFDYAIFSAGDITK